MSPLGGQLRVLWQKYNSNPRRHILESVFIGLSLVLIMRALVVSLTQINESDIRFDAAPIPIALAATLLSILGGALGWAHIVRALSPKTSYAQAIRYHLISIAVKYLPGFGWQQVSKVVQLNRNDISLPLATLHVTLEMALIIITGAITGALCFVLSQSSKLLWPSADVIELLIFSLGILIFFPILSSAWINKRIEHDLDHVQLALNLLVAEMFIVSSWIFLGLGLWSTSRVLYDTGYADIPYVILSVAIGFILSLVIIFVPNGWGVRELILSALLQSILPTSASIATSIIFRGVVIIVEVACVVSIYLSKYRRHFN